MIQSAIQPQNQNNGSEFKDSRQSVTFYCHAPNAKEVSLVGTFNSWDPWATPMKRNSLGEWFVVLDLLPGVHEYQAVVDGKWVSEPAYAVPEAEEKAASKIQSYEWNLMDSI
ncbi:MAG: hypothetical protein KC994_24745 [Candidatus Omnitrophica bacterium]|nr:hypothetical protein [Candidatus Omnitrophota bacterium]